jgi:hypothetical protein
LQATAASALLGKITSQSIHEPNADDDADMVEASEESDDEDNIQVVSSLDLGLGFLKPSASSASTAHKAAAAAAVASLSSSAVAAPAIITVTSAGLDGDHPGETRGADPPSPGGKDSDQGQKQLTSDDKLQLLFGFSDSDTLLNGQLSMPSKF